MGCYKFCKLVIYCLHRCVNNHALLSIKFRERTWPQRGQISAKHLAGHQMPSNWSLGAFFPRHQGWSMRHHSLTHWLMYLNTKRSSLPTPIHSRSCSPTPISRNCSEKQSALRAATSKVYQPLKFKHSMSSLEVKNVICRGFQQINGSSSFQYLECIQNNRLAVVAS